MAVLARPFPWAVPVVSMEVLKCAASHGDLCGRHSNVIFFLKLAWVGGFASHFL